MGKVQAAIRGTSSSEAALSTMKKYRIERKIDFFVLESQQSVKHSMFVPRPSHFFSWQTCFVFTTGQKVWLTFLILQQALSGFLLLSSASIAMQLAAALVVECVLPGHVFRC